jgi:diguanylate cyclase (GGDEF)-like protein/PAS domain S-box-containing protein
VRGECVRRIGTRVGARMKAKSPLRNARNLVVSWLRPLVVMLDENNCIVRIHGDPSHYGYPCLAEGQAVESAFDFMIGLNVPVHLKLPFITTPSGRHAQVQIDLAVNRQIILMDLTQHHDEVQVQQQLANENTLLLGRLLKLQKLIGCMFQHDDLRVWGWDIGKDRLSFDERWMAAGGANKSPRNATTWGQLVHPDDLERVTDCLHAHLHGLRPYFEIEHRLRDGTDGGWIWVLERGTVAERDQAGTALYMVGVQMNIQQRKEGEQALRESEQRFRMLADAAPVFVWMADENGVPVYFNRGWLEFTGRSFEAESLIGWTDNVHPEDRDYCAETCDAAKAMHDSFELEFRFRRHDGEYRWMLDRGVPRVDGDGHFIGYIGTCTDITERRKTLAELQQLGASLERRIVKRTAELEAANAALRKSEERYALVAQATEEGLWDWNLRNNEIYYSPRWKAILGFSPQEIGYNPEEWKDRVHPEDRPGMLAELESHIAGSNGVFACDYRMLHKDGSYHWYHQRALVLRDEAGLAHRIAGSHRDISRNKAIEQQMLYDAIHDSLTGLANRTLLMDRLRRCLERRRRDDATIFALLFMDLDRFKFVNDSLGHVIGDRLLVEVARRLTALLRAGDTLARLGGDEFAILLEDIHNPQRAVQVAERIQTELNHVFNIDSHEIYVGASIGIALSTTGYDKGEDMIRDADTAMYRAKSQGLALYQIFDSHMHAGAVRRLRMESDLRGAIERRQLVLHYQPVVNVNSRRIVGFEALLRWQHPEFGLVAPNEFISLAEETGLIVPIGSWVIRNTCRQAAQWQNAGMRPLRVAVNLSSVQFRHDGLTQTICDALSDSRLDPGWLDLEVTESTLMLHLESTISTMRGLKDLGLMLSMDDFGTGYSSLSCLKRFPLDTLKIDKSFVQDIATDPNDAAIVTAIGAMARSLNMDVIAEGVETAEQLQFLISHDCRKAQGFLFSRPVTAEGALRLMQEEQAIGGSFSRSSDARLSDKY